MRANVVYNILYMLQFKNKTYYNKYSEVNSQNKALKDPLLMIQHYYGSQDIATLDFRER